MSNPPQLSIIICAYTEKRWDDLVAAVYSVQQQTLRPTEIIVVIDHNSALFARAQSELTTAIVIENREARGLSGARNSGIAIAHGNVLAFMDEDAVAASDWLQRLAAHYSDAQVLGVGGAIEPMWATGIGRPRWFPREFDWVVGCTYLGMPAELAPVRNLIGCNMSLRREVFDAAGGFRSGIGRIGTLPVGCEETELCIRAGQRWPGRRFIFEPCARVRHRVPAQRANARYFLARCYAEGISKALVSRLVGPGDGLASERTYTFKTLPKGVARGIADSLRGDWAGLGRASAITLGLMFTAAGYVTGSVARRSPVTWPEVESSIGVSHYA